MEIESNIGSFCTETVQHPLNEDNFLIEGDMVVYRPSKKKEVDINTPYQIEICNQCRHLVGIVRWDRLGNRCDAYLCLKNGNIDAIYCPSYENKNKPKELTVDDISLGDALAYGMVKWNKKNIFQKFFSGVVKLLTKKKNMV